MSVTPIETTDQLDDILARETALIFKHSTRCPVSRAAYQRFQTFVNDHPEKRELCYFVDVVGNRPVSQAVAEKTGVRHESPQAIVLRNGSVAWHAAHYSITGDALLDALS